MEENAGAPKKERKRLFVISPIGKPDETGFDFTNLFMDEIVIPAAKDAGGFSAPIRADKVSAHGSITASVVKEILDADVCVADLTHRNPNVMYEVAIAHAADKPVILLQQEDGGPPFDFADERVIHYSTRADHANQARERLTAFLQNINHEREDPYLQRTLHPVRTIFRELQTTTEASDPQRIILERVERLGETISDLQAGINTLKRPREAQDSLQPSEANMLIGRLLATEGISNEVRAHLEILKTLERSGGTDTDRLRKALLAIKDGKRAEAETLVMSIPPF